VLLGFTVFLWVEASRTPILRGNGQFVRTGSGRVSLLSYAKRREGDTTLVFSNELERMDFIHGWESLRANAQRSAVRMGLVASLAACAAIFGLVLPFLVRFLSDNDGVSLKCFVCVCSLMVVGCAADHLTGVGSTPFPTDYLQTRHPDRDGNVSVDRNFMRALLFLLDANGTQGVVGIVLLLGLVCLSAAAMALGPDWVWSPTRDCAKRERAK
jgi:hypothetical protein